MSKFKGECYKMLKKLIAVLSSVVTVITIPCSMNCNLKSYAEENEDYYFNLIDEDNDGTYDYAEIEYCNRYLVEAVIPSEVEGVPVTRISEEAFCRCPYLESVNIPDSVQVISDYAFESCFNLRTVVMPDVQLGTEVFANTPYQENTDLSKISFDLTEFENGSLSKLDSQFYAYDSAMNIQHQIFNSKQNGIYYVSNKAIYFLSLTDGTYKNVCSFGINTDCFKAYLEAKNITSDEYANTSFSYSENVYCDNSKAYLFGCFSTMDYNTYQETSTPVVIVYDFDTMSYEKTIFPDDTMNSCEAIGADSKQNIYISHFDYYTNENYISVFSAEGNLICSMQIPYGINEFYAFDKNTGNFYFNMDNSVYAGRYFNNSVTLADSCITNVNSYYNNDAKKPVELIDDKYLCIDSSYIDSEETGCSIQSGLLVFDSDNITVDRSVVKGEFEREYPTITEEGYSYQDLSSLIGTRAVSHEKNLIISDKLNRLTEYEPDGTPVISHAVTHPVFSIDKFSDGIYVYQKDSENNYYIQKLNWTYDETMGIDKSFLNLTQGNSSYLKPVDDESTTDYYTWSSSNPNVATVDSEGEVYGWNAGEAVITIENAYGLAVEAIVTVTESVLSSAVIYNTNGQVAYTDSHDYVWNWQAPCLNYLHENEDGSITKLDLRYDWDNSEQYVLIENYNGETLTSTKKIKTELDYFGGAFFGEKYNFLLLGQSNPEESDSVEVVRIIKYTKDWKKIEHASVYGADTSIPFDAGSPSMTEHNGYLYIHMSHEMYQSSDGLNHQSNMSITLDQEYMQAEVGNYNYTSHSFNQFIQTDGEYIYTVDHGDAYPRAIEVSKQPVADSEETEYGYYDYTTIRPFEFYGESGDNYTGAELGGFEIGKNNCIIAFNTVKQDGSNSGQLNVKLAITDKNMTSSKIIDITNHAEGSDMYVSNPQLVKISSQAFLLMWEEQSYGSSSYVNMVTIDENGKMLSDIVKSYALRVSDCQPVFCSDGYVRWYVAEESSPVIYAVNPYKIESLFSESSKNGKKGDVNIDGKINVRDCALIASALAKSSVDMLAGNGDYNGDNKINVRDAAAIASDLAKGKL